MATVRTWLRELIAWFVVMSSAARLHNVGAHPGVINNSNDDMGVASLSVDGHAWLVYRFV